MFSQLNRQFHHWRYIRKGLVAAAFLLLGVIVVPPYSASAQTFNPGCSAATLAANLATAGSNGQADVINLAAGCTYTLGATLVINADSGNLLTINGNDAVISGNNAVRVLTINAGSNVEIMNTHIVSGANTSNGGGIFMDTNSVLEFTGGEISSNTASNNGAGIYNNSGTVSLNDTIIYGNTVTAGGNGGGGIYTTGGTLDIINSSVLNNSTPLAGGGIRSNNTTLTNVGSVIDGNSAQTGGGIRNNGSLTILNSTISNNTATLDGGGIYTVSGSNVTISASAISGNTALNNGGGIISGTGTGSVVTLDGSAVSGNYAGGIGGGIANAGSLTVTGSAITGNIAFSGGGLFNDNVSYATLVNSTVSGNSAHNVGGGVYNSTGYVTLANTTVSENTAAAGGGSYNNGGATTLTNSIIANSTSGGDCVLFNAPPQTIANSLIEDGGCGITNGVNGNLTGDPNLGAVTGNPAYFPLLTGSIAIDAGSNSLIPSGITMDQAGNPRITNSVVDMGSFEYAPPPTDTPTHTPTNTPTQTPTRTPTQTNSPAPSTTPPAPNVNLVTNGTFAAGLSGWTFYNAVQNVTSGELVVAPTAAGGGFYQFINYGSGGEIFEVTFRARNSSLTHKTLNIMVRDSDYAPAYNCVFGMTANTPFQYYTMRFDTSEGFMPMVLQAAITGDSTLGLVMDDITLMRKTGLTVPATQCIVAPPANTELVFNGAFNAGTGSWAAFNATMNSVNIGGANGSIMQIGRNSGTPNGGFYQYSPFSAPANAVLQFSFQIGNQSNQARVINMLVRSPDWTDMHSCFITVPANTPLTSQTILLKTSAAWSNIVMQGWIQVGDYVSGPPPFRFDNISLQYLPASGFSGSTQCPGPLPMPQRMMATLTPSPSPIDMGEGSVTPSLTATYTATATPTATSTETALPSATATASETPTDAPTLEPPTSTPELPTVTPIPTDTATEVPTAEPPTAEPPTETPEPSTSTPEPTAEVTASQ